MSENQLTAYKFARSLSELSAANQFLDPNAFIEVQYQDGSKSRSKKTTLGAIDQTVITTFDLYNNLNDIFNSLEHQNETYFPSSTIFFEKHNPFVHEENNNPKGEESTLFDSLADNNLVTKKAVDDYLKNTGICVPICSPDANYVFYVPEEHLWRVDNSKKPIVMDYHKDGIWTSESKLKFNYGSNYFYFTDEVVAPKNIMLNITGNIVLNSDYERQWFEKQKYFVGLTLNGKLATFVFLKNILKIENTAKEGQFYTVAQFHFLCPLKKGAVFRIVTNANCRLFGVPEKDIYSRKLYDSLNAVNLGYYDYYGNDTAVSYNEDTMSSVAPRYDEPEEPVKPKPELPEFTKKKTYVVQKVWVGDEEHLEDRPDEISVELQVASNTIAKLELTELTTPPWTNQITLSMPENVDIDVECREISGSGLFDNYNVETNIIEGETAITTVITNTYKGEPPVPPEPNKTYWIVPVGDVCTTSRTEDDIVINDPGSNFYIDQIEPVYAKRSPIQGARCGFVLLGHSNHSGKEENIPTTFFVRYNGKKVHVESNQWKVYKTESDRTDIWNTLSHKDAFKQYVKSFGTNICNATGSSWYGDFSESFEIEHRIGGPYDQAHWINITGIDSDCGFGRCYIDRRVRLNITKALNITRIQIRDNNDPDASETNPIYELTPLTTGFEFDIPPCTSYGFWVYSISNFEPDWDFHFYANWDVISGGGEEDEYTPEDIQAWNAIPDWDDVDYNREIKDIESELDNEL